MNQLAHNWWAVALRGVLAVIFGLAAFFMPGITLAVLITLFGAFAVVDGVFLLIAAFRAAEKHQQGWWVLAVQGAIGLLVGLIAFMAPLATAVALLFLMAAWAIITGVLEIAAAIRLRKEITNEWLLGLSGLISVLLGIALFLAPAAGLLVWAWMIGAYALISGILLIALAFRLRGLAQQGAPQNHEQRPTTAH